MNAIEMLLAKPIFQALGWTLFHFIWQGALVAVLYKSASLVLKNRSSNARYVAACLSLGLMLALPVVTIFVTSEPLAQTAPSSAGYVSVESSATTATPATAASSAGDSSLTPLKSDKSKPVVRPATEQSPQAVSFKEWGRARFKTLLPWMVALWLAGVLVLSLRFAGGLAVAHRLKRIETSPVVQLWQEKLSTLSRQLRISRPVRLCASALVEVPTVIGWLRPVILVPASALTGLSPRQLEALLAHELAHIKRYDYLVNLLQTAVETLLFYHPAVWWISNQIRIEREHCCDDLAVSASGDVIVYARALAALEHIRSVAPPLAVAANGGSLLGRIQRLVGAEPASRRADSWMAGIIALVTALAILAGAQTSLLSADTRKKESAASTVETSDALTGAGPAALRKAAARVEQAAKESVEQSGETVAEDETAEVENEAAASEAVAASDEQSQSQETSGSGDFIGEMQSLGYANLSVDDLISLKTHGVTPAFVRDMRNLLGEKLDIEDIISMKIHGVTTDFVSQMKASGYDGLKADTLVSFKIHGVSPQFVKAMQDLGYRGVDADDLIGFRIHGVTPEFVEKWKSAGFTNLSADELTAFRIHGVTGQFAEAMKSIVRGGLDADDLTGLRIHGVTPEYARGLKEIGYTELSADHLTAFKIHGVTLEFIRGMQDAGFGKLSPSKLVELRIHGISPDFVKTVKERGFSDVTVDQLIKLRQLNIMPGSRKR
ncbi:MAG TPA: M56 family metallopeptidase [Blastocatellia bacterium]|nr:M56 family metallopeptidase [Blastocatellia bacterium]